MQFTEEQQKFMDVICSRGGGKSIHELMSETGFDYGKIECLAYELISKNVQLTVLGIKEGGRSYKTIRRIYLSPYDLNYEKLMNELEVI